MLFYDFWGWSLDILLLSRHVRDCMRWVVPLGLLIGESFGFLRWEYMNGRELILFHRNYGTSSVDSVVYTGCFLIGFLFILINGGFMFGMCIFPCRIFSVVDSRCR